MLCLSVWAVVGPYQKMPFTQMSLNMENTLLEGVEVLGRAWVLGGAFVFFVSQQQGEQVSCLSGHLSKALSIPYRKDRKGLQFGEIDYDYRGAKTANGHHLISEIHD